MSAAAAGTGLSPTSPQRENNNTSVRAPSVTKNTKEQEFLDRIYDINPEADISALTPDFINRQCCGCNDRGKFLAELIATWPYEKQRIYRLYGRNRVKLTPEDQEMFLKLDLACDICKHYGAECSPASIPLRTTVYIYFMRHSESCANVLKRNKTFGGIAQTFYSDPELSHRGEEMAKDMATKFFAPGGIYSQLQGTEATATKSNPMPLIFGASSLLRAQQTAKFISDAHTPQRAIKYRPIYEFPYIQEVGGGQENKKMSEQLRDKLVVNDGRVKFMGPQNMNRNLIVTVPDSDKADMNKFLNWLGTNLLTIYTDILKANKLQSGRNAIPDASVIQMVVVTHHNALKQLMKTFGIKQDYDNLDGVEVRIEYDEFGRRTNTQIAGRPVWRYVAPADIPLSCPQIEGRECRIPVCSVPSVDQETQPQSICSLVSDAQRDREYYSNTNSSRADRYYSARLEPIVKAVEKNRKRYPGANTRRLEEYKKPGFFSRRTRRGRAELAGNLSDISLAVGCERMNVPATPSNAASVRRTTGTQELLRLISLAEGAIPNYGTVPPSLADNYYKDYLIPIVNFLKKNPIVRGEMLNQYKKPGFFSGLMGRNSRPSREQLTRNLDVLRSQIEGYRPPTLASTAKMPVPRSIAPVGGYTRKNRRRQTRSRRA